MYKANERERLSEAEFDLSKFSNSVNLVKLIIIQEVAKQVILRICKSILTNIVKKTLSVNTSFNKMKTFHVLIDAEINTLQVRNNNNTPTQSKTK